MTETASLACEMRAKGGGLGAKVGPLHPASDVGAALCEIQFRAAGSYAATLKGSHEIGAKTALRWGQSHYDERLIGRRIDRCMTFRLMS